MVVGRIHSIFKKCLYWFFYCFVCIIAFLIFYILTRIFLFDVFPINTSSMEPTIRPGDRVIVNKSIIGARIYTDFSFSKKNYQLRCFRTRGLRSLRHNDVIVFNYPFKDGRIGFNPQRVYIKRVIAVAGDSISIRNGIFHNNNFRGELGCTLTQYRLSKTQEKDIDKLVLRKKNYNRHFLWTIKDMPSIYVPRGGDVICISPKEAYLYKDIIEWETAKKITVNWEHNEVRLGDRVYKKHIFKNNYVFVAGDNVFDSQDSRYWGVIPEDYIIGVTSFSIHI